MKTSFTVSLSLLLFFFGLPLLQGQVAPPELTPASGFYSTGQPIQLSHPDPKAAIYYTTDGSAPDQTSSLYTGAFILNDIAVSPDDLSQVPTNPEETIPRGFGWKNPLDYSKAFIIKAIACVNGIGCSDPVQGTFFNNPDLVDDLPVISIITDADLLFGHETGIYIPGIDYEQNGYGEGWYGQPNANYFREGEEWEIPVWFEFFDDGNLQLAQTTGLRIAGGATRAMPMKTIRLYARSEYGNSTIKCPVFPNQAHDEYKRLTLRNSGQDFFGPGTLMRDALVQKIAEPLRVAILDYRPSVLFINGEYWGIHNIRERPDDHYFSRKYGIPKDQLDLLKTWNTAEEGDDDHYVQMISYLQDVSLDDPQAWQTINTLMDIENYIDYFLVNVYSNNIDWPGNNLRYWRRKTQYQPHAPWGHDGRWRWSIHDTDFSFGWDDPQAFANNTLAYATSPDGGEWPPNQPWATFLIRKLLENPDFRNQFVNRFAALINTVFSTENTLYLIDSLSGEIQQEMPSHIARWGYPAGSYNEWTININRLKSYVVNRPAHIYGHFMEYFNLPGTYSLTLGMDPSGQGSINVADLELSEQNPLLANTGFEYPWTGTWFSGVEVPLQAVPGQGFVFEKWIDSQGNEYTQNPLMVDASADVSYTALFAEDNNQPPQPLPLHYWHFNNLPEDTITMAEADYSFTGNASVSYPGAGNGYMDNVDDGTDINAGADDAPGLALRVRNPSDTRYLLLKLPTPGYENIRLSYAAKRTSNGSEQQEIWFRLSPDDPWLMYGNIVSLTEEYQLVEVDFSAIEGVANNPLFEAAIFFTGSNAPETTGNNRFDNIRLEGTPMEGTNIPPYVVQEIPLQEIIEQGQQHIIDLSQVFHDADGDELGYQAGSTYPQEVQVSIEGSNLIINPLRPGDAVISLSAADGQNPAAETSFRVLVYPQAHSVQEALFTFDEWDALSPERTYPENMIFLQSDVDDPGQDYPLLFPYFIPHDSYHADDQNMIGFPYNTTGRTRLNGLGSEGISFINTGRGRDLGGALLAVNTTGQQQTFISFIASTMQTNSRIYNLRLQYRIGTQGGFTDITDPQGNPVIYYGNQAEGYTGVFKDIPLPQDAQQQEYVQLLWRYYYTGEQIDETSGQRTMISLDDIRVGTSTIAAPQEDLQPMVEIYPNPASDIINLRLNNLSPGMLSWQITDMKGNIMMENYRETNHGSLHKTINISGLPAGIYLIRVITKEGVITKKISKLLF